MQVACAALQQFGLGQAAVPNISKPATKSGAVAMPRRHRYMKEKRIAYSKAHTQRTRTRQLFAECAAEIVKRGE